ncbi:hypothetical protein KIH86_23075 [Paenibacillus sp. HN-1]|uniref:replicative helicase loader/inhibitor n=1 Tax=Paenibacillus TaxID=44249 RepID=UPI001CA86949|nr:MULTISPECIES: replicative helicase loader/inhibitor [Paenibacillus]MBY9081039.1 hypothetical protein [Paenibacillus sp. CGMCC 1.18879]MBY9087076.1 hypothetical protein [Paenibacillus sinensis]
MNKIEIAKLYKVIKKRYPNFDASTQAVEEDVEMLQDIPYDVAQSNIRQHIMTNDFPPKISQIRGRLGEQIERDRMRRETEELFAAQDAARAAAVPPPPGLKEALYERLGIRR